MAMIASPSGIMREITYLLKRRYPSFVFGSENLRNEIPIFVYHTVDPHSFEDQLQYIVHNHYRTLTADEFYLWLTGKLSLSDRSILLTMDDGRKSVWTYAYPLLKKYGVKASVYIIPSQVETEMEPAPTLEDVWQGRCSLKELETYDPSDARLLSWQEIERMQRDGLIEFQSHTLYHNKIFTSPKIVGFYGPDSVSRFPKFYDIPVASVAELEFCVNRKEALFGQPLHGHLPLMQGSARYSGDETLRESCRQYFQEKWSSQSLPRNWQQELFSFASRHRQLNGECGVFNSLEETKAEILHSLVSSKALIEEHLPGTAANHLCYPYGAFSELSTELSKSVGYQTNFCTTLPDRWTNRQGDNPYRCVRLKNDYIFRLPGKGRRPLSTILMRKLQRRMKGETGY